MKYGFWAVSIRFPTKYSVMNGVNVLQIDYKSQCLQWVLESFNPRVSEQFQYDFPTNVFTDLSESTYITVKERVHFKIQTYKCILADSTGKSSNFCGVKSYTGCSETRWQLKKVSLYDSKGAHNDMFIGFRWYCAVNLCWVAFLALFWVFPDLWFA